MPRSIASLDSPSFCEILLMALGLDKHDYQLGITKVFFRAGKLYTPLTPFPTIQPLDPQLSVLLLFSGVV